MDGFSQLSLLDNLGAALDLISTLFLIVVSPWGWFFCILAGFVNGYLYFVQGIYADTYLQCFYIFVALQALLQWTHPKKKHFPISYSPRYTITTLGLTTCLVFPLAALLKSQGSTVPYLDAITTLFSLAAIWLSSQKIIFNWLVFFILDIIYTYLYFIKHLPSHALLYAAYTIIALIGTYTWIKEKNHHARLRPIFTSPIFSNEKKEMQSDG